MHKRFIGRRASLRRRLAIVFAVLAATFSTRADEDLEVEMDAYGGLRIADGRQAATGWFYFAEVGDRHFWITPEGNPMFSLGITHAADLLRLDDLNVFQETFGGSRSHLADDLQARLKSWGYNTIGYGGFSELTDGMPYLATIGTVGPRSFSAGDQSQFMDLYDAEVRSLLDERVRAEAAKHRDNRFCMGYLFIDLPVWMTEPKRGISYAQFVRSLEVGAAGRAEYIAFLLERHGSEEGVFEAYGYPDAADDASLFTMDLRRLAEQAAEVLKADDSDFIERLAEEYYRLVSGALREEDPHHLILGDRFMCGGPGQPLFRTPDAILRIAAKYVDVLAFQPMGTQERLLSDIEQVHALTGKPIALVDVNTMTRRIGNDDTDTSSYERESGEYTLEYYLDVAECHGLVAIHRCTIRDYRPGDKRFHRRGLLKEDHSEYPLLVELTRRAHSTVLQKVYEGLLGNTPEGSQD